MYIFSDSFITLLQSLVSVSVVAMEKESWIILIYDWLI